MAYPIGCNPKDYKTGLRVKATLGGYAGMEGVTGKKYLNGSGEDCYEILFEGEKELYHGYFIGFLKILKPKTLKDFLNRNP